MEYVLSYNLGYVLAQFHYAPRSQVRLQVELSSIHASVGLVSGKYCRQLVGAAARNF
jgi:hypothetical protein